MDEPSAFAPDTSDAPGDSTTPPAVVSWSNPTSNPTSLLMHVFDGLVASGHPVLAAAVVLGAFLCYTCNTSTLAQLSAMLRPRRSLPKARHSPAPSPAKAKVMPQVVSSQEVPATQSTQEAASSTSSPPACSSAPSCEMPLLQYDDEEEDQAEDHQANPVKKIDFGSAKIDFGSHNHICITMG